MEPAVDEAFSLVVVSILLQAIPGKYLMRRPTVGKVPLLLWVSFIDETSRLFGANRQPTNLLKFW